MKQRLHKGLSLLICFAMLFYVFGTTIIANGDETNFKNEESVNKDVTESGDVSGNVEVITDSSTFVTGNSVSVSTETELKSAIENANIDPENPTIITVDQDIELTDGITVSDKRSIVLQGKSEDITIKFADTVDDSKISNYSMFYFAVNGSVLMTVQNIVLDGTEKGRLFLIGNSNNGAKNKLILETGSVLKNGIPFPSQSNGSGNFQSGGAIRLLENSRLVMNDGLITGNKALRYGGAVFTWGSNVTIEINGGTITNNTGTYSGGIAILGSSSLYVRGGSILNNKCTSIHGGGIFVNSDSSLYLSGDGIVKDNKNNADISNIYLSTRNNALVFVEQKLTGSLSFTKNGGNNYDNLTIKPHNDYIITKEDVSHVITDEPNKVFYLDESTGTIKQTSAKTITFNANYDNGIESIVQTVPISISTVLDTNTFTRSGYVFTSWNTEINGTGTSFVDNASVSLSEDMVLYAQWEEMVISFENKIGDSALTYTGKNQGLDATVQDHEDVNFEYTYARRVGESGDIFGEAIVGRPSEVGYYKIVATATGEYSASATAYLEIKPAELSISAIKGVSKYYDNNNEFKDVELVLDGIQGSDKISAKATATVNSADVGSYSSASLSSIVLNGSKKDNYLLSLPNGSVSVENRKYLSIINPSSPSRPDIEGSVSETGKKVKIEEVRTNKITKDILGIENIIMSMKVKETKEPIMVNIDIPRKYSEKKVYVVQLNPISNILELVVVVDVNKKGNIQFETSSTEELTITSALPNGFISTVAELNSKPFTYFIMDNNEFKKGWLNTDSDDYVFFDYRTSILQTDKWVADGTDEQGNAKWYSLSSNGKMHKSSWIASDATGSKWYYVNESGLLLRNAVIDGYVINADGYWLNI